MKNIRMRKIRIRTALGLISLIFIVCCAVIYWSPYGLKSKYKKRVVVNSVIINAPVEKVFDYLGRSKNASDWSVFVDKIIPINTFAYKDGTVGSIRRCFAKDHMVRWDEAILDVHHLRSRELSVFNAQGFVMMADDLRTQQLYETFDKNKTRLSFTLFYKMGQVAFIDQLKMYIAAYEISRIFDLNLKNIKRFNEC